MIDTRPRNARKKWANLKSILRLLFLQTTFYFWSVVMIKRRLAFRLGLSSCRGINLQMQGGRIMDPPAALIGLTQALTPEVVVPGFFTGA
jgi:hypothetical protein